MLVSFDLCRALTLLSPKVPSDADGLADGTLLAVCAQPSSAVTMLILPERRATCLTGPRTRYRLAGSVRLLGLCKYKDALTMPMLLIRRTIHTDGKPYWWVPRKGVDQQ